MNKILRNSTEENTYDLKYQKKTQWMRTLKANKLQIKHWYWMDLEEEVKKVVRNKHTHKRTGVRVFYVCLFACLFVVILKNVFFYFFFFCIAFVKTKDIKKIKIKIKINDEQYNSLAQGL